MFFFDPTFYLLIPAMILAFYAQSKVKNTFAKFSEIRNASGMSGAEIAKSILASEGIGDIPVHKVQGNLTDHYHPVKRELALSEPVFDSTSVGALGVAAHEVGHAIQHRDGYAPLRFRNVFAPVATFGSNAALPLFIIGFLIAGTWGWLMDLGILFFTAAVVFHLVTLPVEFNASRRAIAILRDRGYLQAHELDGAKKVLDAAAWTYVAAATMAISQLVRLLILRSARD